MIDLMLPWPPSVNQYWRTPTRGKLAGRTMISKRGREYRVSAIDIIRAQHSAEPLEGRLDVTIVACPPDRRKRDLDNLLKAPLDVLTHAAVWSDDEQIDYLSIRRGPRAMGGELRVIIEQREPDDE